MFRTIKSRSTFMYALISALMLATFIFLVYFLFEVSYSNASTDNNVSYYELRSYSDYQYIMKYDMFNSDNITTSEETYGEYKAHLENLFLGPVLVFLLAVWVCSTIIYSKMYKKEINNFLNLESSNAAELQQWKEDLEDKEKEISSRSNDVVNINSYVTHELKNTLMVLQGKIRIDPKEAVKYVDKINAQIDDLNALTANEISLKEVDILLVCANVIDTFKEQVQFEFDEDVEYDILGNELLLERLVYNVIENAFKYSATEVSVKLSRANDNVICVIKNNGPKIDEQVLERIFDMKYRVNPLNKKGDGIGLALVKNIINLQNGSIYVESDENETKFYFSFPIE